MSDRPNRTSGSGGDDPADPDFDRSTTGGTDVLGLDAPADPVPGGSGDGGVGSSAGGPPATSARRLPASLPSGRGLRLPVRRRSPGPGAVPTPSEQAVHIDDRPSKIFVLVSIGAFTLILLNALLLGKGGLFGGDPTASVAPSGSPAASAAVSPSPSASTAASASPSAAGSPSAVGGASGSPAVSGSPAASPASAAPSQVGSTPPSASPTPS